VCESSLSPSQRADDITVATPASGEGWNGIAGIEGEIGHWASAVVLKVRKPSQYRELSREMHRAKDREG
jgi:hypothetical protein